MIGLGVGGVMIVLWITTSSIAGISKMRIFGFR